MLDVPTTSFYRAITLSPSEIGELKQLFSTLGSLVNETRSRTVSTIEQVDYLVVSNVSREKIDAIGRMRSIALSFSDGVLSGVIIHRKNMVGRKRLPACSVEKAEACLRNLVADDIVDYFRSQHLLCGRADWLYALCASANYPEQGVVGVSQYRSMRAGRVLEILQEGGNGDLVVSIKNRGEDRSKFVRKVESMLSAHNQ